MRKIILFATVLIAFNSFSQSIQNSDIRAFENKISRIKNTELVSLSDKLYESQTESTKTIIVLKECVKRNLDKGNCLYRLGVSYIENGEIENGIKELEKAIKIEPKNFKAYFNIGAVCYDIKQYEKSVEYYQKALEIEPKNDACYYGIALSEYILNKKKSSKQNCEKALQLNPNNINAKLLLEKY
jgi:tetratricopeptide (TPR) repeat protein